MLFKILGGILIISASGLMGIVYSGRLSIRCRELKSLRRYMQLLETEITYGATPLPAAMMNITGRTEGLTSIFFQTVARSLSDRSFYTFTDAWAYAAETVFRGTPLDGTDIELLKSFGNILGGSDREDQKKHFELFYMQLKHQEDLAQEELRRSGRMYRSLGFLLGIAVFVVLV